MSNVNLWKRDLYRDCMSFGGLQRVANQIFIRPLSKRIEEAPNCKFQL
ncbi:MAG: hypothetical protein PV340_05490 [Wolbachia sp.]|nr:hypothetical protein [Wolbachia sp.]MDD9336075.1 hypothetical protein [Wolbachia sp.]